ncbi:hypothetical protein VNO80_09943 [Phaseolus coccineus]|uniref:Uncharacterized protein n=1 Tax=Phaseolus coccineus TaxID=3886 RepID=A0AAN9RIZ6_PHACN
MALGEMGVKVFGAFSCVLCIEFINIDNLNLLISFINMFFSLILPFILCLGNPDQTIAGQLVDRDENGSAPIPF